MGVAQRWGFIGGSRDGTLYRRSESGRTRLLSVRGGQALLLPVTAGQVLCHVEALRSQQVIC